MPISDVAVSEHDSSILVVTLGEAIKNTDQLTLAYQSGTIRNLAGVGLGPYSGFQVSNALPGAIPKNLQLETKNRTKLLNYNIFDKRRIG